MSRFAEHVTSTAFHLSLSKRMIEQLCYVEQMGRTWLMGTTGYALIARGLVENCDPNPESGDVGLYEKISNRDLIANPSMYCTPLVKLSKAGELLMPLLREAGLYRELSLPREQGVELPEIKITVKKDTGNLKSGEEI